MSTILIVEDDDAIRTNITRLLKLEGYDIVSAVNGREGLERLRLSRPDVVITDIGMPAVDGFELLDLVKKAQPDLPVFLITGRHEIGDQQRASAKDISGFFRKPFDGPTLLAAVGGALGNVKVR